MGAGESERGRSEKARKGKSIMPLRGPAVTKMPSRACWALMARRGLAWEINSLGHATATVRGNIGRDYAAGRGFLQPLSPDAARSLGSSARVGPSRVCLYHLLPTYAVVFEYSSMGQ